MLTSPKPSCLALNVCYILVLTRLHTPYTSKLHSHRVSHKELTRHASTLTYIHIQRIYILLKTVKVILKIVFKNDKIISLANYIISIGLNYDLAFGLKTVDRACITCALLNLSLLYDFLNE